MEAITSKSAIDVITKRLVDIYNDEGEIGFLKALHKQVLRKKVRFPLLEYAGRELFEQIPGKSQLVILDKIVDLHEIGGNVLAGIGLQLRLRKYFRQSINKSVEYIITGDEWYVCDIIGERVMGHSLLTQPVKTLPVLRKLAKHENKWVVRSVGVAAHYAIKKGLTKEYVEEVFSLLLSLGNSEDFHTKRGIGWAAKTTVKFYPEFITKYEGDIEKTGQWFKTKVKIGLGRKDKYAHRYKS